MQVYPVQDRYLVNLMGALWAARTTQIIQHNPGAIIEVPAGVDGVKGVLDCYTKKGYQVSQGGVVEPLYVSISMMICQLADCATNLVEFEVRKLNSELFSLLLQ